MKIITWFVLSILLAVASILLGTLTLATNVSHTNSKIREQFTYKPKGRHRRIK